MIYRLRMHQFLLITPIINEGGISFKGGATRRILKIMNMLEAILFWSVHSKTKLQRKVLSRVILKVQLGNILEMKQEFSVLWPEVKWYSSRFHHLCLPYCTMSRSTIALSTSDYLYEYIWDAAIQYSENVEKETRFAATHSTAFQHELKKFDRK